jgi:hypothetical protein
MKIYNDDRTTLLDDVDASTPKKTVLEHLHRLDCDTARIGKNSDQIRVGAVDDAATGLYYVVREDLPNKCIEVGKFGI